MSKARVTAQEVFILDACRLTKAMVGAPTNQVNCLKTEVEILRAQNLALRKAHDIFSRNVLPRDATVDIPTASLKTGIESVTSLQVENQELKLRLAEREVKNARHQSEIRLCMDDNNRTKNPRINLNHEHLEMKRALEGLRFIVHRQYLEMQNLKQHSTLAIAPERTFNK